MGRIHGIYGRVSFTDMGCATGTCEQQAGVRHTIATVVDQRTESVANLSKGWVAAPGQEPVAEGVGDGVLHLGPGVVSLKQMLWYIVVKGPGPR